MKSGQQLILLLALDAKFLARRQEHITEQLLEQASLCILLKSQPLGLQLGLLLTERLLSLGDCLLQQL